MRNIKLTIAFDGTHYYGWQRQKDKPTIAGILEEAIFKVCNERVKIIGQGRIDRGAHAISQIATFKTESAILPPSLKKALNAYLPYDIIIKEVEEVELSFNPRHAKERKYRYIVLNQPFKSPLFLRYSYFHPSALNLERMRRVACVFIGKKDFSAFAKKDNKRSPIREIKSISIRKIKGIFEENLICFDIIGTSFLYNMIRRIVATLIKVGEGHLTKDDVSSMFVERKWKGPLVPSCGLFLMEVNY